MTATLAPGDPVRVTTTARSGHVEQRYTFGILVRHPDRTRVLYQPHELEPEDA